MNHWLILRFMGILILFLGVSMIVPLGVSFLYKDGSTLPMLWSIMITVGLGGFLYLFTKKNTEIHLTHRDGVAIVTFGWLAAGLAGPSTVLRMPTLNPYRGLLQPGPRY